MNKVVLVLFDIDGTLLDVHGAGRAAFREAVFNVFGWKDDLSYIGFAGATDLDILRRVMQRHGLPPNPKDEQRFFAELPICLEKATITTRFSLQPGVQDLLGALAGDERILLGLVTGNIEACAKIKLRQVNLHGHFELGAFGHEDADRNQIAGLALQRARKQLKPGQQIGRRFLVGDAPSDVAAAQAIGATAVAVTTGKHSHEELADAGADQVLDDLNDVAAFYAILGLPRNAPA